MPAPNANDPSRTPDRTPTPEPKAPPEGTTFPPAGVSNSSDPSDYAAYMRYAFRFSLQARYTVANLGFRAARDVPPRRVK